MALNSCCSRQIDCALCPKTSQGVLIYSQYPKGQHFPAEKCTQNCIIFILKGELLVNSEEYPGTTLQARQCILQAIGSKVELLALTDVEYFTYRFTELPLLCEERYKDILERAYAPLTYTPLPIIPKLERLFGDLTEYFREQPNTCSRYLDVKCQEIIYILTCYYPIQQVSTFFYPISTYTESFHYFVMQNYDKVKNVEEFAHLGGYTTTTFRRLFKNMYGVPVIRMDSGQKTRGHFKRPTTHQATYLHNQHPIRIRFIITLCPFLQRLFRRHPALSAQTYCQRRKHNYYL